MVDPSTVNPILDEASAERLGQVRKNMAAPGYHNSRGARDAGILLGIVDDLLHQLGAARDANNQLAARLRGLEELQRHQREPRITESPERFERAPSAMSGIPDRFARGPIESVHDHPMPGPNPDASRAVEPPSHPEPAQHPQQPPAETGPTETTPATE